MPLEGPRRRHPLTEPLSFAILRGPAGSGHTGPTAENKKVFVMVSSTQQLVPPSQSGMTNAE